METLCKFVRWHYAWAEETKHEGNKHTAEFISYQLFYDLRLLCFGFMGLVLTHLGSGDGVKYIVPRDVSQDVVENLFGRIRSMSGGQRHPDMVQAVRADRHLDEARARRKKEKRPVSTMDDEWYTRQGNCRGKYKVQRVAKPPPTGPVRTRPPGKHKRFVIG